MRKQRQAYPLALVERASSGQDEDEVEGDRKEDNESKVSGSELGRPTLPKGTKLITFPIGHSGPSNHTDSNSKVEGHGQSNGPVGYRKRNLFYRLT